MTTAMKFTATEIAVALGLPRPTTAQEAVIQAPLSPVLVVAGAGSGKTETMSARVVWLVANELVRRDEILGLTFTRKAAGELAARIAARLAMIDDLAHRGLLRHVPALVAEGIFDPLEKIKDPVQREAARQKILDAQVARLGTGWDPTSPRPAEDLLIRPAVSTYNAFADGVMRDHGARIGRDPDAAMLTPAAAWLLVRDVVLRADIPGIEDIEHSTNSIIDAVQRLAGQVLDHRVDMNRAAQIARDMGEQFAPGRSGGASDAIDKSADNLLALPVLLELVREYLAEKQRRGVLDFADQVSGAFDIVESSPDVRAQLREQYRVVLLDEYQDTSVMQTRFLAALFADGAVMAVGDPHQSIYGWRGASADNLYAFAHAFGQEQSVETHNLMTSWRNDKSILVAANQVLAPLRKSTLKVPPLAARPDAKEGTVEVRFPAMIEDEAAEVAEWFDERRREHAASNPEKAHTGAILFRNKRHMRTFAAALAERGIPHRILGLGGLLSEPEVVDVVSVLRVVHDANAGSALIRVLSGPRFAVGVADLAALADLAADLANRDADLKPLDDELRRRIRGSAGLDEKVSIVDALDFVRTASDDYRMLQRISAEGRARLREAGDMFARLRRIVGQPVLDIIAQIEIELRLDIELAANERRGPARRAQSHLRTFVDEVRSFLAIDDRGTIHSLIAWLEKAERSDELMPRTEPPEPGVVQLLTVHGSKGLEWDAVAVVRLVEGEFPGTSKDVSGWFAFGALPFALRGDAAALPRFNWIPPIDETGDPAKAKKAFRASLTGTSKNARGALLVFKDDYRDYLQQEERRLAYVAMTRARNDLLLSGSRWSGGKNMLNPSTFILDAIEALELTPLITPEGEENPYSESDRSLEWPLDPLGERRGALTSAAELVRETMRSDDAASIEASRELSALLRERELRRQGVTITPPTRIPASRFKDYVTDFAGTLRHIARPMPEKPYPQTALGTLFHAWVEHRYGKSGTAVSLDDALWQSDSDDAASVAATDQDRERLTALQKTFDNSEWSTLKPIEVETEIHFTLPGVDGAPDHLMICKLDAVFRREDRGGRIEIVDWKTGRAPQSDAERDERMLQIALYRLAYHRRSGVALEDIDVALYYVADDLVIRGERVYSEEELVQRWNAARAAR